jgi:FkbM family methyltransferase
MDFAQFDNEYNLKRLELIEPKNYNFQMWITPRFHEHYENNVYEEFTSDLITNYAQNIDLFIDVGAHYGFFSLLVGTANPDCEIIAFEPVPENYEILKLNFELNRLKNAEAINQAVSNVRTSALFNISTASDNCSFIQHPATPVLRQIEVQTVSLNEVLLKTKNHRTLIKIDTDGHELQVLQGFEDILRANDNIRLVLELNPKSCYLSGSSPEVLLNKLYSLGYECYFIHDREHILYRPEAAGANSWESILGESTYMNLLCIKRSNSINALFFSHSSELAGAERSLLELVKELINDYNTICTIVLPSHGPLESLLRKVGAATLTAPINWWCTGAELPDEGSVNQLFNQSFHWLTANLDILRRINPDVVLTNTLVIPWGGLAASMLKRPHIWMVNEFGEKDHGLKFYLPFRQVLEFIEASSDKIVTTSKAVQRELFSDQDSNMINTIYYFIDLSDKITPLEEPKDNKFLIPDAYHIIIYGTVMKSKGQDDAVRSVIELVKNRHRKVELLIVGSAQSGFQYYLQSIISSEGADDYIQIIPFHEDVLSIVNSVDLVLVCSKMEAFGRVIVEAMLMEKAIIATNSGGPAELVIDGETGLLYTPGNYLQLADQIERLLDDPGLQDKLVNNAHKLVRNTFTKERFGGEYHKMLVELKQKEFQKKEGISGFLASRYELLNQKLIIQATERDAFIQTLTAQIESLTAQIESLTAQIESLTAQIETLTAQVHSLTVQKNESDTLARSQAAQIQQLKFELEQNKAEVVSYALSRSWRITRPLRKFNRFIKGETND